MKSDEIQLHVALYNIEKITSQKIFLFSDITSIADFHSKNFAFFS